MNFLKVILTILLVTLIYYYYSIQKKKQIESFRSKTWYPSGYRSTWWGRRHRWIAWWYPNFPGFIKARWRWRDRDQGWGNRCSYIRLYIWNTSRQLLAYKAYLMRRSRSYGWRAAWVTPNYNRSNKRVWRIGILISAYWGGCRAYTSHNHIRLYGSAGVDCGKMKRESNLYYRYYRNYLRYYRRYLYHYRRIYRLYQNMIRDRNRKSSERSRYINLYRKYLNLNRRRDAGKRGSLERYAKMLKDRDRWKSMYNSYGKKLRKQIKNSGNSGKSQISSIKLQIKRLTEQLEKYDAVCDRKSNKEREKLRKKLAEFERFKKVEYGKLQKKLAKIQTALTRCKDEKPKLATRFEKQIREMIATYEAHLRKLKRELQEAIKECRETLKKQKKEVNSVFGNKNQKMKSHVSASKQIKF